MEQIDQGVQALTPADEMREESDVNLRSISLYGLALLIGMALVFAAISAIQYFAVGGPARLAQPPSYTTAPNVELPPQPRFEEIPGANLETLRAREDNLLGTYGWVD